MDEIKVGIIGGSGLSKIDILKNVKGIEIGTKHGFPSSKPMFGKIEGVDVVFILRHGENNKFMPSNVPYQANLSALKELGCTHVLATTACGSLREDIRPGDLIFIDQFIDRTTRRAQTFYENENVCHIPMSEPFCGNIRKIFCENAKNLGFKFHEKGTIVTIEGPRFSSRAESNMFRQWGADLVNMTTFPEVVLARELGMHYAAIAVSTDYDCWKAGEKPVDLDIVIDSLKNNLEKVVKIIVRSIVDLENLSDNCTDDIARSVVKN